jgi:hypothetical protein
LQQCNGLCDKTRLKQALAAHPAARAAPKWRRPLTALHCRRPNHYARVGSGPRKGLCACGVQVEPAAWPGPAFGGGRRLPRGRLSLPGHPCCSPHTVRSCYTAGGRHACMPQVYSCKPELRRCHCHRCCCQHCRPPFFGGWEATAGAVRCLRASGENL